MNLEEKLRQALDRYLIKNDGSTPQHLAESIRYSLLSPGKRIRPRLLLECAEMLGLSLEAALPAALALEMVHCFTLIHDDLPCMDDDDFRRGMPSNHKKFGEGIALLAGDALMALAVDVFLDSQVQSDRLLTGLRRLTWAMGPRGVIGGQAAEDLLHQNSQLEDLRQMHRQKTGALFSAALLIPKDFAGISDDSELGRSILAFADELGLAFQVADDLEDADTPGEGVQQDPTSILFFQSKEEAAQSMRTALALAAENLLRHWGDRAQALTEISDEVIQKIERAVAQG